MLPYIVEVYTGNEPGSETDSNVYLQLIGSRGDSGKRILYSSISDVKVVNRSTIRLIFLVLLMFDF